jgi:hypothetical protein
MKRDERLHRRVRHLESDNKFDLQLIRYLRKAQRELRGTITALERSLERIYSTQSQTMNVRKSRQTPLQW